MDRPHAPSGTPVKSPDSRSGEPGRPPDSGQPGRTAPPQARRVAAGDGAKAAAHARSAPGKPQTSVRQAESHPKLPFALALPPSFLPGRRIVLGQIRATAFSREAARAIRARIGTIPGGGPKSCRSECCTRNTGVCHSDVLSSAVVGKLYNLGSGWSARLPEIVMVVQPLDATPRPSRGAHARRRRPVGRVATPQAAGRRR
jgi:hypothetical protein